MNAVGSQARVAQLGVISLAQHEVMVTVVKGQLSLDVAIELSTAN